MAKFSKNRFKMISATIFIMASTVAKSEKLLEATLSSTNVSHSILGEDTFNTPKNTTVLTSEEIENSGAQTIAEALQLVAGVNVSYMGGRDATFDIRGQGETSGSNVLILLDGIPLNSIDLSGPRTSQISLSTIEKIEVIPSGGAVLYGDGAIGGIINIVSKNKKNIERYGIIEGQLGSYDLASTNVSFGSKITENSFLDLNYYKKNKHGYRELSKDNYENIDLKFTQFINDGEIELKYSHSNNEFSAPNSLTEDEFEDNPTLGTAAISGSNKYDKYGISLRKNITENIELSTLLNFREQEYRSSNDYNYNTQDIYVKPQLKLSYSEENSLILGMDYFKGETDIDGEYGGKNSKRSLGGYVLNKFNYNNFSFFQGYRNQDVRVGNYKQVGYFPVKTETVYNTLTEEALELSGTYKYRDTGLLFISFSQGFRTPNTDELNPSYWSGEVEAQRNKIYEIGIKENIGKVLISASTFISDTENEIFYDAITYKNRNLEGKTKRKGTDLSLELYLDKWLFKGSYSYIEHSVKSGSYEGKKIPGVPNNRFALGTVFQANSKTKINLDMNYNGSSYYFSDYMNVGKKLDSYITVDSKISYNIFENLQLFMGINNIFDEKYSDFAANYASIIAPMPPFLPDGMVMNYYSYYPANGRNYYGGFKYSF
ncbi:MAG: TonB-dependent receptor [Fusobacteriaceae bacterium]